MGRRIVEEVACDILVAADEDQKLVALTTALGSESARKLAALIASR